MNRSRIVSALLACLLVTAGVAGPLSQPAVAAEAGNCSDMDDFVMFLTLGAVNSDSCSREAYVQDAIADYEQTDATQTKVDIYSQAVNHKAGVDAWYAPFNNYLQDTETVAWSKMQVEVAEAYQNDSSLAQAQFDGKNAIEDYYTTKAINLIEQWNASVSQVEYLRDTASQESGVSSEFVRVHRPDGYDEFGSITAFTNRTMTLPNGSTRTVRAIEVHVHDSNGNQYGDPFYIYPNGASTVTRGGPDIPVSKTVVMPSEGVSSQQTLINHTRFMTAWSEINSLSASSKSEADTFINSTYDSYSSGEVNASDVISSQTAMFEYGTRSGDANESLYDSVGALALGGFDTPNLNGTGTMDVRFNNQTYTGLMMARNVPGGSWTNGTTYNTSNISGPVFVATTTGEKVDIPASTEFTVESIRAQDGSSMDSVATKKYNYKTANTSELLAVQSELSDLRAQIESRQQSGGAGGGSGGFGGNTMLIVLAAAAAAAIALGSQNGGGRRGRGRR